MKRIGILTGGGDAPGLNGVIRAVVLAARDRGDVEVVGIRDGFGGFAEGDEGVLVLDRHDVRGTLLRGGSILGCNNSYRGKTSFFLERVREIGLDGLIVCGGDGSLTMAHEMVEGGGRVVGVPKTIDNDVAGTDQTFGFDTAATLVADMCVRLIDTAESHHRVMLVEVMGRHAGHIALHGALAGAADVALVPEIPYHLDAIVAAINRRAERRRTYTLIVTAEGARRAGDDPIRDEHRTKLAGREVLGGIAATLADELRGRIRHEVRSIQLSHLQRGGAPTVFDRVLGTRMGVAALHAAADGASGVFTALRKGRVELAPLAEAAGKRRTLDPDGDLVATARAIGIALGD
jgi:6-phosphofructokinase 1